MEKKRLRKKDILRMDGLLPPTRRLPVCDAVSGASDKKKEKKWSIGGILRRISSIRDYDSSSNDEEIVYCNRTPKKLTKLNRLDGVVLHSMEDNLKQKMTVESNVRPSTDSHRDSLHSRSSDGSLDGLGKKTRKNKLKARAKAKRDYLCVESSSDEDCRRSNNSLNRIHDADGAQNGQRSNMCNRKTRAARTERYIKRLSRDEGNGTCDSLSDSYNKKCSLERTEDKQRALYADVNGLCRPPAHPRRFGAFPNSSRALPVQRSSMETFRDPQHAGLPNPNEAFNDYRRYSTGQYVTDLNQNNAYGKISRHISGDADNRAGNFFTYPTKNACHYSESFDYVIDHRSMDPDSQPPVPPPRDPRYRVFNYGYSSYPMNRHQHVPNSFKQEDRKTNTVRDIARPDWRNLGNYGSNNELAWRDKVEVENSPNPKAEFRNSLECINNKYNCSRHRTNESTYEESEAMRCRRRNTRNDQLNCIDANYGAYKAKNKSANICESNEYETISSHASVASSDWSSGRSPCNVDNHAENNQIKDNIRTIPTEKDLENRRRSSRNLEEALSELEAIYNSLRLGDEDLLDRAERRSMEEFSLKQAKNELDAGIVITPDSPDRTKDDMAYRRMHPKERPTSLSDIAGQSTLSNISYLIASPVLSRRDSANDLARLPSTYPSRRDEPDVMRDDVVFRSINHANNTLRIIDPQPPFGIPLGPVATATESDYLHTTPTKPEQPRSSYIPQCEPDVVTDDLAYRALRKDAGATRNVVGENRIDVSREQPRAGLKKKRAVRSLSANLYGLINQDRIHLRREPSLDTIKDEIQNVAANNLASMTERPEYLRRVVSDGELSDIDAAHRRREPAAITGETDINGNHPAANAYRKKLCISPQPSPKKEKEPNIAKLSDAMLSSTSVLDDKFWHEYLGSDSNVSMPESSRNTETVFTTYSRLCQDLVNLIKSDDGDSTPLIESSNDSAVMPTDKPNDFDVKLGVDEPSISVPIRSLSSHCPERNARANDEQSPTAFSIANSSRPASETTPAASNLDFYLCAVDENVRLIAAEAFDGSTDRLRDSRLSARKNSWTSRSSEVENQSASTRSSTLYSQDDQGSDDRLVGSSRLEDAPTRVPSKRNSSTINDGDQDGSSHLESVSTADAEFSKAVRDLELAAASLCEHEREIEDLGRTGRGKKTDDDVAASITDEDAPMRKINLIADALRQERERDQEEITVVPPSGIETTRSDARDEVCRLIRIAERGTQAIKGGDFGIKGDMEAGYNAATMIMDDKQEMEGFWISGAIHAIKALSYVYDLLTFPVYLILQRPWEKRKASRRIKARPISKDDCQVTYRSIDAPGSMHVMLEREKVDTLEKVLLWVVKMYGDKKCLGTRQILADEDEPQPNGRIFKKYKMGEYKWKSFNDVDRLATSFGRGLVELGMKPRKNVVIFAETRAEWMIAIHACFKQNFTVVTIYATLGDEAIAHGINETEVDTVITSHDLLPKFKRLLDMMPEVKTIIYMEDQLKSTDTKGYKEGVRLVPFSDVVKMGNESKVNGTSPKSSDTAIIMYTSGSTGVPKGVILSHKNIISTLKAFSDAVQIRSDDVFLGFLPLAHVFELLAESVCLLNGVPIGYSSPLTLIDSSSKIQRGSKGDASVLHPTCLTAVPLILDRISKGINENVKKSGPFRQAIFNFAYEYKLKWTKRGYETPLFDKYIFRAAKQVLGGRVRLVLSGGAPLSPDTHNHVKLCLCVTVTQGYGLTETSSCATVMDMHDRTTGRVGAPTTICDIRLENWEEAGYRVTDHPHPRGEIVIGGDMVSAGYYKLPDKTKEDFFQEDGRQWFRTGDIGEFNPDGSIKIIDRKKDLVKLQLGEYVSLGKVESELKTCPVVENICVYGDANKAYTVALVVPNQHYLEEIATNQGITGKSLEELCNDPQIEKAVLQELVEQAKKCKLQGFEIPGAVKLCAEQWSPDMGLVTAAFKLKRKAVQERYQHEINRMYAS